MKQPAQALQDILRRVHALPSESVDVLEALGRVLAEDVRATRDLPPWDNSAMDGYALRAADGLAGRPVPVAFTVAAGDNVKSLQPGQVARIMTGAPVPQGADAVIMREEVDESNPALITMRRAAAAGENIRMRGDDVTQGTTVLRAGTVVAPAEVALLCSVGRSRVRVHRRPTVAILSTGDELAELGDAPHPARIVNSNAWMLAAQVRDAGGIARVLGIAHDTREALVERLAEAKGADVLVSSGGVSVGEFDFVKEALESVGARLDFWRVAIKPGKPLAVGVLGETLVFGLPGNPVSSFVTFELFVRPTLMALQGRTVTSRRTVRAKVQGTYAKKPGMTHYLRAELSREGPLTLARMRDQQSSGALTSIAGAHGLMVVEDASSGFSDGDLLDVIVLREDWDG